MDIFNKIRNFTYVVILALFFSLTSYATHIKAGEFSARRLSNSALEYEITLTLYYNTNNTNVDPSTVNINFGDGSTLATVTRNPNPGINIGNNTTKNIFTTTHTYNGASTYIISMQEINRNSNIYNIALGNSQVPFYVELQLKINPLVGLNSSPIMTVPPIDFGAVGKIFTHNPGAYDPDGDSLSYEFITPQFDVNAPILGYNSPAAPVFGGQSTLGGPAFITLNPSTGDIVWNTPSGYGTAPRYYNIAIKITEWRFGRAIGYIVRDMQVEIEQTLNNPPKLVMPKDTCIEAGTFLRTAVSASDPDIGNPVKLEAFGQTFELVSPSSKSTFPVVSGINPSSLYSWQTRCSDVRSQPYQVVFKATDQNQVPLLVDIRTWLISVKGPKVKGITATPGFNSITLNWPLYSCSADASFIRIYRRDCDSVAPNLNPCKTGPLPGYKLVGIVPATATTFIDNNNGAGLDKGKSYCYVLVAMYPAPGYGESYPSNQICVELNRDVAVYSSIDVTETSSTTGKVFLKWYNPSAASVTGPYSYDIDRGEGLAPIIYTSVATGYTDTTYTDTNLDTKNKIYSYRIKLVNNNLNSSLVPLFDLTTVAGNALVNLSWTYHTPWITDSLEVYRKVNSGTFSKLVTLAPTAIAYTDNTVTNCDTAYYYIKQYGGYCDKALLDIATQTSAIDSVRPLDDNPPVAPVLTVDGCDGDLTVFQNVLNWTDLSDADCNTIDHYNVYFAIHNSDELNKIYTTTGTTYTYINNQTTAGCYQVSATNLAGVEGARSTKICVDDCIYYELPNLLTLNKDGKNDVVEPFPVPRGAAFVRYYVYNRWGSLVYYKDTDPNINWDGKVNGKELSDGVYYFLAEVHFHGRVNKDDEIKNIKGWVQILTTK